MTNAFKHCVHVECPACDGSGMVELNFDPRKYREKSGYSLRQIATLMEISAQYLSDMERGRRAWSDALLTDFRIACKYGKFGVRNT